MARTHIRLTVLATAVALSTLLPASAWARPPQPIASSKVDGRCMIAVRTEVVPQNGRAFYVAPPLGTETTLAPCPSRGVAGLRRDHIWTANQDGTIVNTDNMCLDVDISRPLAGGTRVQVWRCIDGATNQSWFRQPGTTTLRSRVTSDLGWCLTALGGVRAGLLPCAAPTAPLASAQSWYMGLG